MPHPTPQPDAAATLAPAHRGRLAPSRSAATGALFAALALALLAAWISPPASAQTEAYQAEIIENRVLIRSGAGRAYYEVGQLRRGDTVTVQNELFGWYRITPPQDVFCFIERKNVDAKNDGSRGVVNTDDTNVMAAHVGGGPADSYRTLLKLGRGDTVEIVDTVSNVYKIRPPEGAYVYLPPNTIEPLQNQPPAAPPQPQPVDAQDSTSPTPPAGTADDEPAIPDPPRTAAQSPAPPSPEDIDAPAPAAEIQTSADAQAAADATGRRDLTGPQPPVVVAPTDPSADAQTSDNTADRIDPLTPATPEPATTAVAFESPEPAAPDTAQAAVDSVLPTPEALLNDPGVRVARPEVPVATRADNEMLRAVEIAILPYFTLPVEQQPIAKMVRGYADAAQIDGLSDNDLAIIRNRLTELQRNRDQILSRTSPSTTPPTTTASGDDPETTPDASADLTPPPSTDPALIDPASATNPDDESTPDPASAVAASPNAPSPSAPASPPAFVSDYNAIGILIASTVHTGDNQPKLLRLMDPTGRRTVAYLEPNPDINTLPLMGQLVGIVGQAIYDPTTKLNLIRPEQIDTLTPR